MMMERAILDVDDLRFKTLNNALYHMARRRYLEGLARFCNFLVIMLGASTLSQFAANVDWLPTGIVTLIIGLATTLVGALQLVFDFAGRARTHELLQRRYYELLGRIEDNVTPDERFCASVMGEIARISGEEPPTYRVVDAIAYNEALGSLYGSHAKADRCHITWLQRLTRHVLHHANASFEPQPN